MYFYLYQHGKHYGWFLAHPKYQIKKVLKDNQDEIVSVFLKRRMNINAANFSDSDFAVVSKIFHCRKKVDKEVFPMII